MRTSKKYPAIHLRLSSIGVVFSLAVAMILFATEVFAQSYQMTLNQRRMGDTIGVEVWVKDVTGGGTAANLGNMSIAIQYDEQFLTPAGIYNTNGAGNPSAIADSIDFDMDIAQPYRTIASPYAEALNDFVSLDAKAQQYAGGTIKVFQLDVKTNGLNPDGYKPGTSGKGTFIGTLKFDIKNPANASTQLSDTDLTGIQFYTAETVVTNNDGDVLTNDITFTNPGDFVIRGITVLNPNKPNQAVNRYASPALQSIDPNNGYPIFFERSGIIDSLATSTFNSANYASTNYGAPRVAYYMEYSLNDGAGWLPVGYVAETPLNVVSMGANVNRYVSGDLDAISTTNDPGTYYITDGSGDNALYTGDNAAALGDGYGGVLRVIWKADENFPFRSEQARFRVSQVQYDEINGATYSSGAITSRTAFTSSARRDICDYSFVLGRLFFVQLNGTSDYFRTERNFDNPTQLTVEAWINVNSINADPTAEPGIVVMSNGETTTEEGAWMLYLAEGQYPAFRAREVDGRSGGYVAQLQSVEALTATSDASPISDAHGDNWRHIAATVSNGVAKLFVDGVVVDQVNNTDEIDIRMPTWSQPVWVGVNPNGGIEATDFLNAGIKEVKVWRTALSENQISQYIAGVFDAAGATLAFDEPAKDPRIALELYYPFQAARLDIASDFVLQDSRNPINFYNTTGINDGSQNTLISYRPDRSHIRLVSPNGGEGVSNLEDIVLQVKWAAYGLGKIEPVSANNPFGDIQIMASRDGGLTFFDAIDNSAPVSYPLNSVEIEAGVANWEPYNNITVWGQDDDLQGIVDIENNYSKSVILRISGTEDRNQFDIFDVSEPFTVAPFFAYENKPDTYVKIDDAEAKLNLNGSVNMFEAWIKPFRFPNENDGEDYYTILSKGAEDGTDLHYALRLLPTGQLQFAVGNTTGGNVVTATSSAHKDSILIAPNEADFDSTWYHVAVYTDLNNGGSTNSVYFYIDGVVQRRDDIALQLGPNVTVSNLNRYPAYIGFEPGNENSNFVGAIKEVRFWGGNPGSQAPSGNEPSDLTFFIQGASSVRANELTSFAGTDFSQNLVAAFTMNGGSFVNNGIARSIPAYPTSVGLSGIIQGNNFNYSATLPFMKLVEPYYRESIRNSKTDVFVRWIGFDYNRNNADSTFRNGNNGYDADLEFSVLGSGGLVIRPLQPVASEFYSAAYVNAMTLPASNNEYEFLGAASKSQFALNLDASVTDPDINDDGLYNDQGAFPASSHNGLLRLTGRSSINGVVLTYDNNLSGEDWGFVPSLRTRSDLFTVTPPSNFTVRVLLEGFHTGSSATGGIQNNIGTSLAEKGMKITLYTDNGSQPGAKVANGEAESVDRYENATTAFDPANFASGNNNFANIPFVFTSLIDGRYFVLVDHINHLPVLSRFPAPFLFAGDEGNTWAVESGWDFTNWNGSSTALTEGNASQTPPLLGTNYSAYGLSSNNPNEDTYSVTGLIYNNGRDGSATNSFSAMVGGDVYADGRINAADRARVVLDNTGQSQRSDVTGDGLVNYADRVIVYRNSGKISSIDDLVKQGVLDVYGEEEGSVPGIAPADGRILAEAPELSEMFIRLEDEFINATGIKSHNGYPKHNKTLAGGLDYKVNATTAMVDANGQKYIDVALYIQNVGGEFALGNSTFGVEFDAANLVFVDMLNMSGDDILWDERTDLGYMPLFSGPDKLERTKNPLSTVRTIDVNYDIYSAERKPGMDVPYNRTYLGTLRFAVKSPADAYYFNWHRITGITTTTGLDVTGDGTFEPIDPIMVAKSALVIFPNGGEALKAGKSYTITWTKPSMNIPVHIDFSTDNGSTWTRITNQPIMSETQAYNWNAPRVNSTECLISIVSANTGLTIDKSDAPFAIISTPAEITRPSINDPIYRGGSNDFIRWNADNQTDVRFEFSANGLDNWSTITPTVNSDLAQTNWTIPMANTKSAVVRMIDINTNEVLAVSSPFRILAGTVTLQSPSAGETLKFGEKKNVRWIYDNVDKFDMQLSVDGGKSWEAIEYGVKANDKTYPWMVANFNTNNAIIRAIYANIPELEYSRTGEFAITGATSVDENDATAQGYVIGNAVPNPFNATTDVTFELGNNEFVTVGVYNMNGQKVLDLMTGKFMPKGSHTITLDGTNLSSGTYTIYLNAGQFNLTKEVILIK